MALLVFGLAGTLVPAVHALEEAEEFNDFVLQVELALDAGDDLPEADPHQGLECLDCLAAGAAAHPGTPAASTPIPAEVPVSLAGTSEAAAGGDSAPLPPARGPPAD